MSFETEQSQKAVMDKTIKNFVDVVGLKIVEQDDCCITFDGDKVGYVTVRFAQKNNKLEVKLETREFEYPVKKFVEGFK